VWSKPLRQSTQPVARILDAVRDLRSATGAGDTGLSFAVASTRATQLLERTLDLVALTMVRQPLHRLQKLPNGSGEPFLYDDSWLGRDRVVLEEIADRIEWPTQYSRVVSAARGLYRGQPEGTPTWAGPRRSVRLDLSFPAEWLNFRP
jgi:hypothetical protein